MNKKQSFELESTIVRYKEHIITMYQFIYTLWRELSHRDIDAGVILNFQVVNEESIGLYIQVSIIL